MKARQKKTLKRTSSCPDVHELEELVTANKNKLNDTSPDSTLRPKSKDITDIQDNTEDLNDETILQETSILSDKAANASIQTDEFLVSPYEHLFPYVMPQWLSNSNSAAGNSVSNGENKILEGDKENSNPYEILDHYIEAAYKTADIKLDSENKNSANTEPEIKKLKDELSLLHNQLFYERHRREVLGLRNRRLLGKTKSSRVLEEQNASLNDRLRIATSEMTVLSEQLEQLRFEKRKTEDEHIRKERERDLEVESLTKEKVELKQAKCELESKVQVQAEEIDKARLEISKLEAALFHSKADVDRLEKKEDLRKMTEDELVEARKEIVLQGELLRKYREKFLDKPLATAQEKESLYKENFEKQMEGKYLFGGSIVRKCINCKLSFQDAFDFRRNL